METIFGSNRPMNVGDIVTIQRRFKSSTTQYAQGKITRHSSYDEYIKYVTEIGYDVELVKHVISVRESLYGPASYYAALVD